MYVEMPTAKTNQDNLKWRIRKLENLHYQISRLFIKLQQLKECSIEKQQTDQWNKTECRNRFTCTNRAKEQNRPKTDFHKTFTLTHFIYDRGDNTKQQKKNGLSVNGAGSIGYPYGKKISLPHIIHKSQFQTDHRPKCKSKTKLSEDDMGNILITLG